jgi:hypothetical protein
MKFLQIVVHLVNLFVDMDSAELSNKTVLYVTNQKMLSKLFILLMILVLLWRNSSIKSFLFMLRYRETLSTGLFEETVSGVYVGMRSGTVLLKPA